MADIAPLQQVSEYYYAVIPIPVGGTFQPARVGSSPNLTAGALVTSLYDATGAPVGTVDNPFVVTDAGGETSAQTPLTASSGVVSNAIATASLGAAAAETTFITGLQFTASGATAASVVTATLTGLAGGVSPLDYIIAVPAGVDAAVTPLMISFNPPLAASAVDTAITLSVPALGSGNTAAVATLFGFRQA
jgi:hypothetical protein